MSGVSRLGTIARRYTVYSGASATVRNVSRPPDVRDPEQSVEAVREQLAYTAPLEETQDYSAVEIDVLDFFNEPEPARCLRSTTKARDGDR